MISFSIMLINFRSLYFFDDVRLMFFDSFLDLSLRFSDVLGGAILTVDLVDYICLLF